MSKTPVPVTPEIPEAIQAVAASLTKPPADAPKFDPNKPTLTEGLKPKTRTLMGSDHLRTDY